MSGVHIDLSARIALDDRETLAASIYRPVEGQVPAIVVITPYGADRYHATALDQAGAGFAFVTVNTRGRGGSSGAFIPFEREGADLAQAIAWAAAQPWCDGRVVTWGGSYSGFAQWSMLRDPPTALKAVAPTASVHPAIEFPFGDGIARPYMLQWLSYVAGASVQANLFADRDFWRARAVDHYRSGAPFRALARGLAMPEAIVDRWLAHRTRDAHWQALAPQPGSLSKARVPVLSVTGQYDADLPGALAYHRMHRAEASDIEHRLVIGPWDHAGTRTPAQRLNGLDLGAASLLDLAGLQRGWFAHHLHGAPLPPLLAQSFTWYQFDQNAGGEWRSAASIEAASHPQRALHLRAADGSSTGTLGDAGMAVAEHFVGDPLGGDPDHWIDDLDSAQLCDDREVRTINHDGLVYLGPPLTTPAEIVGAISIDLRLACDTPDADLLILVHALDPAGTPRPLFRAARRLRLAETFAEERLRDGSPFMLRVDNGGFVGITLNAGSRLRVAIRVLNSPYWEKNWQSGGSVADESRTDARTATITLFTGGSQGSRLHMPIVSCAR